MTAIESDWILLRESLPLLQDYVLSRDIYWPMRQPARSPSGLQVPQLTIGNLRLSQARLSALSLDGKANAELEDLERRIQRVRDEWRANWANKAVKEHESRLMLWGQNIRELIADPHGRTVFYTNAVRQRAILRLLQNELIADLPAAQSEELALLDQSLHGISHPGPFVWEPEVQPGFPVDDFWFLYVSF